MTSHEEEKDKLGTGHSRPAHHPHLSIAEFIPSSQRYASAKLARAVKYRGRKDQQAVSQVRREGLHVGQKDDPLEKRSVFA